MASEEQHSNLHVEGMEADDHIDAEHMSFSPPTQRSGKVMN